MMHNHEQQFARAMTDAGVSYKDRIIADGQIHRFPTKHKERKDGWFVFHGMAVAFGDWNRGIHESWSVGNSSLSQVDFNHLREQQEKARRTAEEERLRKHEETAAIALS
jgi:putative DNA primase/helicase